MLDLPQHRDPCTIRQVVGEIKCQRAHRTLIPMPRQNPSVQRQSSDPLETYCSGPFFPLFFKRKGRRKVGRKKKREGKEKEGRGGGGGAEEELEGTTEVYIDQPVRLLLFFEEDGDSACI